VSEVQRGSGIEPILETLDLLQIAGNPALIVNPTNTLDLLEHEHSLLG
jgi:hypothetical protein